jgi:DNA-binding transcriptional ArsR family regulator
MPPIDDQVGGMSAVTSGGWMISVCLGPDALVGATFAVSPLAQIGFLLNFGRMAADGGRRMDQVAVNETLIRHDLRILLAIRREIGTYAPGFMFASGEPGSLDTELHQVASTPSGRVARQMSRFLKHSHAGEQSASAEMRTILAALESGERSFAQRVASELEQFWLEFMSGRWNAMRALMEGDIRHRAASMARRGLSATLNSLHPAFSYGSGALQIRDEHTWRVFESKRIVLHPSPLAATWVLRADPWGEDGTHLAYPVGAAPKSDIPLGESAVVDPLGKVIGQARLLLLADLASSRTTTELAERHHMTASTVSYHLLRLHRVGLLSRTREGSRVYYQRTPDADSLVARRERWTASKSARRTGVGGAVPSPRPPKEAMSAGWRPVGAGAIGLDGGRRRP